VLILFALFGPAILGVFGISDSSLTIAGGVILFIIALRMIFRSADNLFATRPKASPSSCPGHPLDCGPTAIAT